MKTFTQFMESITIKKATVSDRKKGESYVVHDGSHIVDYDGKRMDGLKRETAKEVAKTDAKWEVASSAFAQDQGIT